MEYPKYPEYKPSDINWLGVIPSHWNIWKVTHGFGLISSGTTPKCDNPVYYDGDIPWVTTSELRENVITDTKIKITDRAIKDYPTLKLYDDGDLAIAMYGATIGRLGILGVRSVVNQACCVFGKSEQFFTKFFYYWLWMKRPVLISLSVGGGQPNLSQDDLRQLRAPIPSINEQKQIAEFLDHKTTQIDCLIEKKKALIEKLNEKRIALITQAVTKGLDPDAPTKPSDVDWLGDVPAHWDVRKLKFCIDAEGGGTPNTSTKEYWDGDIPWVSPKDMKTEHIFKTQDYITELGLHESATHLIKSGAVLLVVRSGILRHSIPVAINAVPVTINQDMKALIVNSDFLLNEYLMALVYGLQKSLLPTWSKPGCTVESIEFEYMINTQIPLPSIEEQSAIVFKINEEKKKIDAMLHVTNQTTERLAEYRTALITAAVTGKIDVR
ncbi:MAG: restriction endonuclease subunit S, partial [Methylobacter sp.]